MKVQVGGFLAENEFTQTSRTYMSESKGKGDTAGSPASNPVSLTTIYNEWREWKSEKESQPMPTVVKKEVIVKKEILSKAKEDSSSSSSGSDSDSNGSENDKDSDVEMADAAARFPRSLFLDDYC